MKPKSPLPRAFRPGRHLEIMNETVHDPYREREKLAEPCVCSDCGAVYRDGRWQWIERPPEAASHRCAACRRIRDNFPAGYVTIDGPFAQAHHEEIMNRIRRLEEQEKAGHPMKRIISMQQEEGRLSITTTEIHLARGIGEALRDAYQGHLDLQYGKEEYQLRVHWHR